MSNYLKMRELELLKKRLAYMEVNKLEYYDPYPFQVKFHNDPSDRKAMLASNQTGKTVAGCVQDAFDLTGLYPDWYKGKRYDKPVKMVIGCFNNELTRDILQFGLFGDPTLKNESFGHAWIPIKCLDKDKVSLKRGVTDAYAHVMVKHHTNGKFDGWSKVSFATYEAGKEAWMGSTIDIYHGDEECKMPILAQMGRGCIATGGAIRMTFTPENGETDVLIKVRDQWSVHEATFKDIAGEKCEYEFEDGEILSLEPVYTIGGKLGHVNKKTLENLAMDNPPWMLKTRMLGLPMIGEGLVFGFMENEISCDPFKFPEHFKFIDAIDFGGSATTSHPTAFARIAYDIRKSRAYIYDTLRWSGKEIDEIADDILALPHTDKIPVIWPHDGNKKLGSDAATKVQYWDAGVNMFRTHFTNPPDTKNGKREGEGGNRIMPGVTKMSGGFNDGTLKVFNNLHLFFEEYRKYHLKDGDIVDKADDLMSACRYAFMSIRHAKSLKRKSFGDLPAMAVMN